MRRSRQAALGVVLLALLAVLAFPAAATPFEGDASGDPLDGEVSTPFDAGTADPIDTAPETDALGHPLDGTLGTAEAGGERVGGPSATIDSPAVQQRTESIRVRNQLRQADARGEFAVTTTVRLPDRVTEYRLTLPANARDVRATGFERDGDQWVWDGNTAEPSLTYRLPADRTIDQDGPIGGQGDYLFYDAGDWALVQMPGFRQQWRFTGTAEVRTTRENVVDGEGAAGEVVAFLGPHEEYTREAHGQRFRLIVPAAADMAESPDEVFDSLEHASGALQVGDRDPVVFAVAAPTNEVQWGVRGLQTGSADMWVRDVEELATPDNVWIHEYVHTRQGYRTAPSARWFTEATATYYAALLTLERGDVGYEAFRSTLARGERDPQASSVLSEPDTWRNNADYLKGALVAGEIDRRIRLATGGERTLATVFRDMNAHEGQVTSDDFLRFVRNAGGSDARTRAERLTTTRESTSTWSRDQHDDAFGQLPARIGYSIRGDDAVRVSGEYRDRAVERDPVMLVAGERLDVTVTVRNTGGVAGEYDLTMLVDEERVDERSGRVDADATTTERFEHRFEEPGEYDVNVGGSRLTVVVTEPAALAVSDLRVEPGSVTEGDRVTIRATVENPEPIPGKEELTVTHGDETVHSETVRLDAGEQREVETTVRLRTAGDVTVTLGDASQVVTVDPGSSFVTPGFGPAVALVALVLTAALAGRRRR